MLEPIVSCALIVASLVPIILYAGYDFGRYVERRRQSREVEAVLERLFAGLHSEGGES